MKHQGLIFSLALGLFVLPAIADGGKEKLPPAIEPTFSVFHKNCAWPKMMLVPVKVELVNDSMYRALSMIVNESVPPKGSSREEWIAYVEAIKHVANEALKGVQ